MAEQQDNLIGECVYYFKFCKGELVTTKPEHSSKHEVMKLICRQKCTICRKIKPTIQFFTYAWNGGMQYRTSQCMHCQKRDNEDKMTNVLTYKQSRTRKSVFRAAAKRGQEMFPCIKPVTGKGNIYIKCS